DGRKQRFLAAILPITQDRTADLRAMHAELMRSPGARPQRQQGRPVARLLDHAEVSQRLLAVLVIDLHGLAIARAGTLGERQVDRSFGPRRHADHDGPVELLGFAVAETLGQALGRLTGAGDQQQPRGILVEAMDQPWPIGIAEAQRVEHAVDMALGAAAALHREPRRLVERDHPVVAMDDELLDLGRLAIGNRRPLARLGRRRRSDAGRQAHGLPLLDPVLALDALAVEPYLAGAQELLQRAMTQIREMPLEPAVEPQARLVAGDGARLDLAATLAHGGQPKGQAKMGPWNRCRCRRSPSTIRRPAGRPR